MDFITKPIWSILLNAFVLWVLTLVVTDIQHTGGLHFFVVGGVVLGLVNFFMKPLIKVLSLPFVILSGGLFLIVINMFVLWFLSYFIGIIEFRDVTFVFPNWATYVIGAIVFGIANWLLNLLIK